jgi:ubiquinone/menaquinone biosynthesis C-methylase UbiE
LNRRLDGDDVATAYDAWSEHYDGDPNRTRDAAAAALDAAGLPLDGIRLVEAGCGTGRHTQTFARRAREVLALDFSEGMLARARARVAAPNVRFVRHDLREPWPVADAWADVLVSMLVLEHIDDLGPVFAQAARVLREGGTGFLCELHPTRQASGRQAEVVDPATGMRRSVQAFVHAQATYIRLAESVGFEVVDARARGLPDDPVDAPPRVLALTLRRRG